MLRDRSLIPLSHQHHNGLALCVLVRRSLASDSTAEKVAKLARGVIERFETELVNHFETEEQTLFPMCSEMPLIDELLRDHRAMEALVSQMRVAPTAELLDQFCELLSTHIRREENVLFEEILHVVPREALDRAGAEIDRLAIRTCLNPRLFS